MIRPIEPSDIDTAVALLGAAFPDRAPDFWRSGMARRARLPAAHVNWPPGYFLIECNEPRGVMLTFASPRPARSAPIVNLSSWFIDANRRRLAPAMLKRLTADSEATFTDLTPTPPVASVLAALGFRRWNEGSIFASWPHRFVMPRAPGRIVAFRETPREALSAFDQRLLEDHEHLGCVCAVLWHDGHWQPLIFLRSSTYGAPSAYVVYVRDRAALLTNRRAALDFLARRGIFALRIDGDRAERPRDCVFIQHPVGRYFRGDDLRGSIDYAYSELVFLKGL